MNLEMHTNMNMNTGAAGSLPLLLEAVEFLLNAHERRCRAAGSGAAWATATNTLRTELQQTLALRARLANLRTASGRHGDTVQQGPGL